MLRNELVKNHGSITRLLDYAEKKPPMNYDQFKLCADAAMENVSSAIKFLNDGFVEHAALCAIRSAEYLAMAGEATGHPYIKRGQKALLNSRKGHEKTYGTKEAKEERNRELQTFIDDLKKKRPDIKSHTALCDSAAILTSCPYKLSGKTIRSNTKNPYK